MKICTACGHSGEPIKVTEGSLGIEIVLWCCFLAPGILYSIWRLTTRHDACSSCKGKTLVPLDSPMGRKLSNELRGS